MLVTILWAAAFGKYVSMKPFSLFFLFSNPKYLLQGAAGNSRVDRVMLGPCVAFPWHVYHASLLLSHSLGQDLAEELILVPQSREIAEGLNKRRGLYLVP